MRITPSFAALLVVVSAAGCGGRGGLPPELPPMVKGPDGRQYYLLDRGAYKGFYDRFGRLNRIEYDSNGDGKPDVIAHHDGQKSPHLIEVDEDFDGAIDRWEDYNPAGVLIKVGVSRRHRNAPDLWIYPGPGGLPERKDYDDDGDMRVDRSEYFRNGLVVRVELDSDGNDKIDRWQDWRAGRLFSEDLDSDGDGKPDRRILYSQNGSVLRVEPIRGE